MCRDCALVELGALLDVGLDVELSAGCEQPSDLVEEHVAHHEALRVALLPPGIGEVEVDTRHRSVRLDARQSAPCVFTEDARSRSVTELGEAGVSDGSPLATDLEPHEPRLWGRQCTLDEEPGLGAGADLELQLRASDHRAEIHGFAVGEPRRVVVRAALSPGRGIERRRNSGGSGRFRGQRHGAPVDVRAGPVKVC